MALLFPKSIRLRITSSFFGTMSTLFLLFSGIFKSNLEEIYNMRLFIVTKILSLEEKRLLFRTIPRIILPIILLINRTSVYTFKRVVELITYKFIILDKLFIIDPINALLLSFY